MRYRILVSTYAGTSNKGAEALLCGLATILERKFNSDELELSMSSIQPEIDSTKGLHLYEHFYQRASENYYGLRKRIIMKMIKWSRRIKFDNLSFFLQHYELLNAIRKQDLFIEMGADNYDVEYGEGYKFLYQLHRWIKAHTRVKMLLYDCSLNPNSVTPEFIDEINRFDKITIRESESMENLSRLYHGEKVQLIPDPAFVMEPSPASLPDIMCTMDCVGVNLSNLIMRDVYGVSKELIYANYYSTIDYVLSNTKMGVVLLPHVMKNQDLSQLRIIKEHYSDNSRVVLIDNEDLSAPQLKYIISRFRFLITARTHASIAAYSTYIPTLVLGYSVKSRGIARDLFGTYNNYVIPVFSLTNDQDLLRGFKWLINHEGEIKRRLQNRIPLYQLDVMKIGVIIHDLIK